MKFVFRPLSLALALFTAGAPSWAAQHDQHNAHHPTDDGESSPANAGQAVRAPA